MRRRRKAMLVLVAIGWIGTLVSHVIALGTDETDEKQAWEDRRDRFLLLSSLTTNTLVLSAVYRYATGIKERLVDQ